VLLSYCDVEVSVQELYSYRYMYEEEFSTCIGHLIYIHDIGLQIRNAQTGFGEHPAS